MKGAENKFASIEDLSYAGRAGLAVGSTAANGTRSVRAFLKEEPLVLAGIGAALSAHISAAFPPSEPEERFMGEASDAVKLDVAETAEWEKEKGKAAAEQVADRVADEVKQQAEDLGLVPSDDAGQQPETEAETPAQSVDTREREVIPIS